jgi:predicted GIY-YIG superfamily endonuclease
MSGLRWFVYLVRCGDGTLYTGIAIDVARRLEEHRRGEGKGAKYLRGRGPLRLELEKAVGDRSVALSIESRIKKLRRAKKEELISRQGMIDEMIEQLVAED